MNSNGSAPITLVAIDDDERNLEFITDVLSEDGLEIFSATDARQGIELALKKHPAIVLLDLVFPELDGMKVLERIIENNPAIEVILMTGHYSTDSAVEAIQKGACDYLTKPLSAEKLRSRVGQLVQEARRRQKNLQLEQELLQASGGHACQGGWNRRYEVPWSPCPSDAGRAFRPQ